MEREKNNSSNGQSLKSTNISETKDPKVGWQPLRAPHHDMQGLALPLVVAGNVSVGNWQVGALTIKA